MMNIDYAMISGVGDKKVNEDYIRACRNKALNCSCFILADGLGGHGNGDVASSLVAGSVEAYITSMRRMEQDALARCFDGAQTLLRDEMRNLDLPHMRTTLVLLTICDGIAQWGHIGDSRLYLFRKHKLLSRTRDHSVPQMLCNQGEIQESDIRHHPLRNRLLRAMGEEWDEPWYDIDASDFPVEKGDCFLLCSDGFWEWIDEKQMTRLLRKPLSADKILSLMTKVVEKNGFGSSMDNYSAILVKVR